MQNKIKRGDLYYANLEPIIGSEQGCCRPVLIVQNKKGNIYSPTTVTIPITSNLHKSHLPTHVVIPKSAGLENDSIALAEQVRAIDNSRFLGYVGSIDYDTQSLIDKALTVSLGLEKRLPEMFMRSLCPRCEADYRSNGFILAKKGWQDYKTICDFCQLRPGWLFNILN